jgi:hypothetical protein
VVSVTAISRSISGVTSTPRRFHVAATQEEVSSSGELGKNDFGARQLVWAQMGRRNCLWEDVERATVWETTGITGRRADEEMDDVEWSDEQRILKSSSQRNGLYFRGW